MTWNLLSRLPLALLVAAAITSPAAAQGPSQTTQYQATDAAFLNPERGFMQFSNLLDPWNYGNARAQGVSIVYAGATASAFRNAPLSQSFLNQIQNGFDEAREHGIKVKFRLNYNNDGGADAPKSVILGHIEQLRPLWEANKDVIFHMDAGFIGAWGEWHGSTNGNDTVSNRTEILGAILDALPVDRTVGIRTPHYKRQIFGGSSGSESAVITAANAFDGSDLSRVGHLNDCFLSSPNDVGTYVTPGWSRAREIGYIGGESRYAAHGGETCGRHECNDAPNAIAEMTALHTDYLNINYHPDVIQHWRDAGAFDEIARRLGYRFELKEAALPTMAKPAGLLPLEFTIDNVGFGELFNPRPVEVVLRHNTTGEVTTAKLSVDPRWWAGGEMASVETQLVLPEDLAEGQYTVALWMPDADASIRDDVRYAIRFANTGVWEAATGYNVLTTTLAISEMAPGPLFEAAEFAEAIEPGSLSLLGDFNNDGVVNAADYTVWRDAGMGAAEYGQWAANYGAVLPAAALSVPEPGTLVIAIVSGCLLAKQQNRGLRPRG
ncbi:DUF4832 domain-containing protein [Botrimarina mediterranea]|uniref:DUF4832 domain-containing protein n=1 Tax=Botrimarina mediterranea TaxID=2528022 RepID=A0A518K2X0_9BACT|nr:DUF4832 domain-containing protein [Botrimarina mediterranea]QDV72095.1 hypothetical protein Spa11_02650 [Botrimarina mediterranea]